MPNGNGGAGIYLFDQSGIMLTGLQQYAGGTYYFSPKSGEMLVGWQDIGGQLMYFGEDGKLLYNIGDAAAMVAYQATNAANVASQTAGSKEVSQKTAFQKALNEYNTRSNAAIMPE